MSQSLLPRPDLDWGPAYESLALLAGAMEDEGARALEATFLIAGMQAGEPIEGWLLSELLALAGIDCEVLEHRAAGGMAVATLQGAGLLSIGWDEGTRGSLYETAEAHIWDRGEGERYSELYRMQVLKRMRTLELGRMVDEDGHVVMWVIGPWWED